VLASARCLCDIRARDHGLGRDGTFDAGATKRCPRQIMATLIPGPASRAAIDGPACPVPINHYRIEMGKQAAPSASCPARATVDNHIARLDAEPMPPVDPELPGRGPLCRRSVVSEPTHHHGATRRHLCPRTRRPSNRNKLRQVVSSTRPEAQANTVLQCSKRWCTSWIVGASSSKRSPAFRPWYLGSALLPGSSQCRRFWPRGWHARAKAAANLLNTVVRRQDATVTLQLRSSVAADGYGPGDRPWGEPIHRPAVAPVYARAYRDSSLRSGRRSTRAASSCLRSIHNRAKGDMNPLCGHLLFHLPEPQPDTRRCRGACQKTHHWPRRFRVAEHWCARVLHF